METRHNFLITENLPARVLTDLMKSKKKRSEQLGQNSSLHSDFVLTRRCINIIDVIEELLLTVLFLSSIQFIIRCRYKVQVVLSAETKGDK